jgi:hypothetical protein
MQIRKLETLDLKIIRKNIAELLEFHQKVEEATAFHHRKIQGSKVSRPKSILASSKTNYPPPSPAFAYPSEVGVIHQRKFAGAIQPPTRTQLPNRLTMLV